MRAALILIALLGLGACAATVPGVSPARPAPQAQPVSLSRAIEVSRRIEPVAEAACRAEAPGRTCDFTILVDRDPRSGVNAFQTNDPADGRPVIILTLGLVDAVRNDDELAFVIGHEMAHHIAGHIASQNAAAEAGARIFGTTAIERGMSRAQVIDAARLGALLGARQFGQAAELEADALGAVIACRAGFDPVAGAAFFSQLPDPGSQIFGTHPPNAARLRIVAETAAAACR